MISAVVSEMFVPPVVVSDKLLLKPSVVFMLLVLNAVPSSKLVPQMSVTAKIRLSFRLVVDDCVIRQDSIQL